MSEYKEAWAEIEDCLKDEEDGQGYLWDFLTSGGESTIRKALKQAELVDEMVKNIDTLTNGNGNGSCKDLLPVFLGFKVKYKTIKGE